MKNRIHFLNMGRYGSMDEHSYRNQFSKEFDWAKFNLNLISEVSSGELLLAFDPSYISKTGKHTHGVGYFYSGGSGKYERGLEIGVFAAIDVHQKTAYHIESKQTKYEKGNEGENLIDQYCKMLTDISDKTKVLSRTLVVDAYFYKSKFISHAVSLDIEVITRLRTDANLRYIFKGDQKIGRGRPKKYDGKIDLKNIDKRRFKKQEGDDYTCYEAEVYCVSLGINIKISCIEQRDDNGKVTKLVFMSSNVNRPGIEIYKYYKLRYQIEFTFREAKQFTGLEECQARDEAKLDFHFNSSLTSVNVAKYILREGCSKNEQITYSVSDIKTELSNKLLLDLFLSKYGINPNLKKNNEIYLELLNFGKRAA